MHFAILKRKPLNKLHFNTILTQFEEMPFKAHFPACNATHVLINTRKQSCVEMLQLSHDSSINEWLEKMLWLRLCCFWLCSKTVSLSVFKAQFSTTSTTVIHLRPSVTAFTAFLWKVTVDLFIWSTALLFHGRPRAICVSMCSATMLVYEMSLRKCHRGKSSSPVTDFENMHSIWPPEPE